MEDVRQAIRQGPKLELILQIRHTRFFSVPFKDIEVVITGLKIRRLILIIEVRDYNLVLKQQFLNMVKFSQDYKPDGVFGSITYFQTQKLAIFQTLSP